MQTYSVDFFLMALFTRKACHGVFVAGGGVSPASGVVPATAMVTAAAADGAAPTSSGSVLGDEVEGLQRGHYQRIIILMFSNSPKHQINTWKIRLLQLSTSAPTDDPAVPKVELRSTPRLARRSCPFSPLLRLLSPPGGSHPPWSRCYAEPRQCEPSLLRQRCWGGSGPAGGCRVAAGSCGTVLYVLAEGFQLAAAEQSLSSTKSSQILTSLGGFRAENNSGT
jgi:hypothetical protein